MSTRVHIGAKELRGDLAAYAKRFGLLEVSRSGKAPPSVATLKRWRKAAPPAFEFVAVAGPELSHLRPGAGFERELEELVETINLLSARCALLRTPVEVTPTRTSRDRLARLLDRLPRDATQVAWEPRGVWEVEDAAVFAQKVGVTLVVDASRDPVPLGAMAYVRLPAIGHARSYSSALMERVADRLVGPQRDRREAYVVIETDSALEEAKRLRRLLQSVRSKGPAGGGRLPKRVQPTSLRVRDDEQE